MWLTLALLVGLPVSATVLIIRPLVGSMVGFATGFTPRCEEVISARSPDESYSARVRQCEYGAAIKTSVIVGSTLAGSDLPDHVAVLSYDGRASGVQARWTDERALTIEYACRQNLQVTQARYEVNVAYRYQHLSADQEERTCHK